MTGASYVLVLSVLVAGGCGDNGCSDTGMGSAPGGMKHGGPMGGGNMHSPGMAGDMMKMSAMMVQHLGAADAMYDARFIAMMIPHHEGAVVMARDALSNASRQDVAQDREIAQMTGWRKQWYAP